MIGTNETNFLPNLLLTDGQVSNLYKSSYKSSNEVSVNARLSKTQL